MAEIIYNADTIMKNGYPKIQKLGACSPQRRDDPLCVEWPTDAC